MPDLTGQSIGRYHIIEPLGVGGMWTVYNPYDTRLECDVAIKFIRKESVSPNKWVLMSFKLKNNLPGNIIPL